MGSIPRPTMMLRFTLVVLTLAAVSIHAVPLNLAERVPEIDLAQVMDPHVQAVKAIEMLQSQGQDDTACRETAEDVITNIGDNTNTSQTILNQLTSGEECAALGQDAVTLARTTLSEAETRHATAVTAVTTASTALVTLSSQSYSFLANSDCGWIHEDTTYLQAELVWSTAVQEESDASVMVNVSTTALQDRIIEAAELKKNCECVVQGNHIREWETATADDAANLAAWNQAQNMLCVLDADYNATHKLTTCTYDGPPQNTKPFIAPAAENQVCQIAPNIEGECELGALTGREYYALEQSTLYAGTIYCYHIKVGSEDEIGHIRQDTNVGHELECNEENFTQDQTVGSEVSQISSTEQVYTQGTSAGCGAGRTRQGHLRIHQDPNANATTAAVNEPSVCEYDVVITVPQC